MREADILDIVRLPYEAALDDAKWGTCLSAIGDLLGGLDATLEVHHTDHPVPLFFEAGTLIPADGIADYLDYYCTVCPRLSYSRRPHRAGHIGHDYDIMPEAELDRDEFYADFLGPHDLRYFMSATLASWDGAYSSIYVHRTHTQGHVGDEEMTLMRRIMPHVGAALDVHLRLQQSQRAQSGLESTLDFADFGALLVNRNGNIVFANRAASAMLGRRDGLSTDGRQLRVDENSADRKVWRILDRLFNRSLDAAWSWGGDVYARRPGTGGGYLLSIRQLPDASDAAIGDNTPMAVVFIRDTLQSIRPATSILQHAFGLTRAESEVACAIADETTLHDLAATRQVKVSTIHSQLKSAMHKLNVRSRSALVRRVLAARVPPNK